MRSVLLVVLLSFTACTCGGGALNDAGTGGGSAGGAATGGGEGGGSGGGAPFSCAQCGDAGVCVDGAACAASCPDSRAACAGACCAAGSKCCAVGEACTPAAMPCPKWCPDGARQCPEDQFCQGTACVATCDARNRCAANGCCAGGSSCVDGGCALPDLVPLGPVGDAGLVVERRNFDATWCDVRRGCVKQAGERSLLHFKFRVANEGLAPIDLSQPPYDSFLTAACVGDRPTTLRYFARWELKGLNDAGVLSDGAADLHCLRDDAPDAGKTFTCNMQGLSAGYVSDQPAAGVCTSADVSNLDAGNYLLTLTLNPTGNLPEARLDNNRVTFPVVLPDTSCRGRLCGAECCAPNTPCSVNGGCALPDLIVDEPMLAGSVLFETRTFPLNDCAISEGCLLDGGTRRLLRFATSTPNVGEADFFIGDPALSPNATFDACHGHHHYHQYAAYRLLSDAGEVVRGRKQAFCALDSDKYWPDAGPRKYDCDHQGVTVGWADTYPASLDCQWVDITDVPAGYYTLEVEVNPNRYIAERNYANNVVRLPVGIPTTNGGTCVPTPEICANGIDEDCDNVADDGCPPLTGNETCATAHDVGGGGEYSVMITAATVSDVTPSCGGAGGDVFFKLRLMVPELVYLSTYGSAIDTVLAVYSGAATCPGTESACTDDGCALTQSHVSGVLPAGDYVIAVKAKSAGATGLVKLQVQRSPCTSAQLISGPMTVMGNNTSSTNANSLSCAGTGGLDDTYYVVTCPSSTMLTAATCGASWDTVLAVKSGSCRANETACDDDTCTGTASRIITPLARPGHWFIIVDGYNANDKGTYPLSVSF